MIENENKSWTTVIGEAFVATLFFVVAAGIAGFLQESLSPDTSSLYSLWFIIGMVPFLVFARARGVFVFDRWDAIAFAPVLVIAAVATALSNLIQIFDGIDIIAFPLAILFPRPFVRRVRCLLPESSTNQSPEGG